MPSKSYPISPAKIGSQDGFRLPKAFSGVAELMYDMMIESKIEEK